MGALEGIGSGFNQNTLDSGVKFSNNNKDTLHTYNETFQRLNNEKKTKRPVVAYTLFSALESQKQVDTTVQASLPSPLSLLFLLHFPPSLLLSLHMSAAFIYHLAIFFQ